MPMIQTVQGHVVQQGEGLIQNKQTLYFILVLICFNLFLPNGNNVTIFVYAYSLPKILVGELCAFCSFDNWVYLLCYEDSLFHV